MEQFGRFGCAGAISVVVTFSIVYGESVPLKRVRRGFGAAGYHGGFSDLGGYAPRYGSGPAGHRAGYAALQEIRKNENIALYAAQSAVASALAYNYNNQLSTTDEFVHQFSVPVTKSQSFDLFGHGKGLNYGGFGYGGVQNGHSNSIPFPPERDHSSSGNNALGHGHSEPHVPIDNYSSNKPEIGYSEPTQRPRTQNTSGNRGPSLERGHRNAILGDCDTCGKGGYRPIHGQYERPRHTEKWNGHSRPNPKNVPHRFRLHPRKNCANSPAHPGCRHFQQWKNKSYQ